MEEQILDYFGSFEEGSRIVAARHFFRASEAYLYAARLREAGIPHYISNTNIMTALPLGGGGDIGLHVRAQDLEETTRIIARLDFQKEQETENDFRDADLDDIEYQRQLSEASTEGRLHPYWYLALVLVAILVALRAYLRASGVVNRWWDFF
ncbi:MAG: hypothetical protein RIC19_11165 [Phaeodactylibacter sp.]|uniref:hypothetical protein n=1 Tax=Phaeodactylibacter sp. TaxID=1940289 RepID=UPI0032EE3C7B